MNPLNEVTGPNVDGTGAEGAVIHFDRVNCLERTGTFALGAVMQSYVLIASNLVFTLSVVITTTLVTVEGTRDAIQRSLYAVLQVSVVELERKEPVVAELPTVPVTAGEFDVNPVQVVGETPPVEVDPVQNEVGEEGIPKAVEIGVSNDPGAPLMKLVQEGETNNPVGE